MTLFGETENAVPAKPKRAKRPPAENAAAVQRLEAKYTELFEARWGFKPTRNYGRERKALGELERQEGWGEEAVAALLPVFFRTSDSKITRGDYSLVYFVQNAMYLRQLAKRVMLDPRTQGNIDAALRAAGGHK